MSRPCWSARPPSLRRAFALRPSFQPLFRPARPLGHVVKIHTLSIRLNGPLSSLRGGLFFRSHRDQSPGLHAARRIAFTVPLFATCRRGGLFAGSSCWWNLIYTNVDKNQVIFITKVNFNYIKNHAAKVAWLASRSAAQKKARLISSP